MPIFIGQTTGECKVFSNSISMGPIPEDVSGVPGFVGIVISDLYLLVGTEFAGLLFDSPAFYELIGIAREDYPQWLHTNYGQYLPMASDVMVDRNIIRGSGASAVCLGLEAPLDQWALMSYWVFGFEDFSMWYPLYGVKNCKVLNNIHKDFEMIPNTDLFGNPYNYGTYFLDEASTNNLFVIKQPFVQGETVNNLGGITNTINVSYGRNEVNKKRVSEEKLSQIEMNLQRKFIKSHTS
jgi:hypothetical protein